MRWMTYRNITSEIIKLTGCTLQDYFRALNHRKLSLADIENLYEKVFCQIGHEKFILPPRDFH